jgi:hypothetical protein
MNEEEINQVAYQVHGVCLATLDDMGVPYRDHELRCYRDLSLKTKIWISFKTSVPKKSLTMRRPGLANDGRQLPTWNATGNEEEHPPLGPETVATQTS